MRRPKCQTIFTPLSEATCLNNGTVVHRYCAVGTDASESRQLTARVRTAVGCENQCKERIRAASYTVTQCCLGIICIYPHALASHVERRRLQCCRNSLVSFSDRQLTLNTLAKRHSPGTFHQWPILLSTTSSHAFTVEILTQSS